MGVYEDQAKEFARTPQTIVTLGMRYCANHYAQVYRQDLLYTDAFEQIIGWTPSGGTTVTANTHEAPSEESDPVQLTDTPADTLDFAIAADYILNATSAESLTCASKAFTASVWARTVTGTGTVTLRLQDSTNSEGTSVVHNLTEDWQRISTHRLFTGGATGAPRWVLLRGVGGLASVVVWRANLTENPGNVNAVYLWPSVFRYGQIGGGDPELQASRCQATDQGDGARCFYSFPTCQDRAHFNAGNAYEATAALKGIREFRFCRKDSAIPLAGEDIRPHILAVDSAAQKIDPERAVTESERVQVRFADDKGPGLWDQQKSLDGALVNTALEQGSFWRRFLAIFRNYANPACYAIVKRGFVASGMTEALYVQRGRYLLNNMAIGSDGNLTLSCTDPLKLIVGSRKTGEVGDGTSPSAAKGPPKISATNVLTVAALVGDTTLNVTDASEFTPPGDGYTVTILIGTEEMNVTARDLDANTLTVTRGRWGTTAAPHVVESTIAEVIEYGTERSSPSLTPMGKNPIDCCIEDLRRCGVPEERIDRVTLEDERDTWLPSTVDTATGVTTGTLFRRRLTKTTDFEKLLTEKREVLMLDLWVDEEGLVTGRVFAPSRPTVTLATLTDDANFIADSVSVDDNDESRITACLVAYDLRSGEKGEEIDDFHDSITTVEPELESDAGYGRRILKAILSQWIQPNDAATASKLSAHYLGRFRQGARKVKAQVELKDDGRQCGDFVQVTTALLQDSFGATDANRQMQIVRKEPQDDGRIALEMIDATLYGKYGFIAPAGHPDWDVATPEERRYCFIGSAGANQLGLNEDGFLIW